MKISIIIPAHNEEKLLGKCLESIFAHKTNDLFEVIVVDNASTDRTAEVARSFPKVRVAREPEKGLTKARERGLLEARGELLAYLDADTRVHKGWFEAIRREFTERKDLVCLSGPYQYYDLHGFKKFLAALSWRLFAPATYFFVGYMVLGGNFVAKKEALLKMGGFDTSIAFYGEDTNIAWRLHKLGKVLFKMDFYIWTSGRRLIEEGIVRTFAVYALNYIWGVLFHKPFTRAYKDVRREQ